MSENSTSLGRAGRRAYHDEHSRVVDSAELLQEAAEAVEAPSLGRPTQQTLRELIELRDKDEAAITRLCAGEESPAAACAT